MKRFFGLAGRMASLAVLASIAFTAASTSVAFGGSVLGSGDWHTCWIKGGALKCVGANNAGQLGDGSKRGSSTLVDVAGLGSGVTSVAGGSYETCAAVSGSLRCWGYGGWNFVGPPPASGGKVQNLNSTTPMLMQGLTSGVAEATAGVGETCALVNGGVKCWGYGWFFPNYPSTAGDTSTTMTPLDAPELTSGVTSISGATYNGATCAIQNGGALCWGAGYFGERGNPQLSGSPIANPVIGLSSGVSAISAAYGHTCAIVNGGAKCWGERFDALPAGSAPGAIGNGTHDGSDIPVDVKGLGAGVTDIATGTGFSCAVQFARAYCWGDNSRGQLGETGSKNSAVPVAVPGLRSGVSSITAGGSHACAVAKGALHCWGGYPLFLSVPKSTRLGKSIPVTLECTVGCRVGIAIRIGKQQVERISSVSIPASVNTAGTRKWKLKLPRSGVRRIKSAVKAGQKKTEILLTSIGYFDTSPPRPVRVK